MTTMLLATTGGHLEQLEQLASRIDLDDEQFWVTHDNQQSRTLLDGRDVHFVPYVRVRNLPDVARCVPTAHRLWKQRRVTRVVSTGSGIALGYLPYLASRQVECHYIESAARVGAPSLTGRVLERLPRIQRYTQYPAWAGHRWQYAGSVFDSFVPGRAHSGPRSGLRVVVMVGTAAEFPFDRLLRRLVRLLSPDGALAAATGLPVEVLWQTGCTPTDGWGIDASPFVATSTLSEALSRADIVISHAGTGSALGALQAGRCPLLAPRTARLGEAGDDHQVELAAELERRGLAIRRDPESIEVEDLLMTTRTTIDRAGNPPPFTLWPCPR